MYEVIYFSRGGSTQKLAAAIASELCVQARHVRWVRSQPQGTDIFLGSGLYFTRPARMVREFIRSNDFTGKRIALFGTSSSGISVETVWMEWLLKRKGAVISGKYHCPGKFAWRIGHRRFSFRGGRPGEKDLERARQFARSIRDALQAESLAVETSAIGILPSAQSGN